MITLLLLFAGFFASAAPELEKLTIPSGYKIDIYATVDGARSLTQGPDGVVFVGSKGEGKVYALLADKDGDGKSDGTIILASGLRSPNGVAYKNGDLYVAEISRILIFKDIAGNLHKDAKYSPWGPQFPSDAHHGWKFIAFGPDGWLYVPVGAPCNICEPDPAKYAAIFKISPDGRTRTRVAQGIRNTVGFDWQPGSGTLWFTDNGRDNLGDDVPPCELNKISKSDEHFGYPYCHGRSILDPQYGKGKSCGDYSGPEVEFQAHVAPLGMRFVRRNKDFANSILVAQHGSWNRTVPVGYQVVKVGIGKNAKVEPLVTGFLQGSSAWGRPVDVLELKDGSILISDDEAGVVYRLHK
jgi:glucose/arabinose dehydrogenase